MSSTDSFAPSLFGTDRMVGEGLVRRGGRRVQHG